MSKVVIEAEDFPVVDGLPLRLSFAPDAIREHFDGDPEMQDVIEALSDEELMDVGAVALQDDLLYRAFHEALVFAVKEAL